MNAREITPQLIQLTKFGLMNAYLVREEDGFTLIDTTMSAADDLVAAATNAGAEIKRIVLTHGHGDHAGSVDALRAKLGPDVPLLISEIDAKILAGESVDFGSTGKKRGSWPKLSTRPDGVLVPGERVESLEIIAAPGHTPGQVAFRDTRDNSLIAGDAFSAIGGLAVPNHLHWRFPLPYLASCDRAETLPTAITLGALDPSVLVVGHGPAINNPGAAIEKALATARKQSA